jgi:hypothetical protein
MVKASKPINRPPFICKQCRASVSITSFVPPNAEGYEVMK